MKLKQPIIFILFTFSILCAHAQGDIRIVERGFLYDDTIPPTCHAATITETPKGEMIAVFFGGSYEGHPDSDEWICHRKKDTPWSKPEILAEGKRNRFTEKAFDYDTIVCDRKPCYNPVLYTNAQGKIVLDYKIGRNMQDWTGWEITSKNGKKWTNPRPLANTPEERHLTLGPIKNKPLVNNGRIIAGSSTEVTYDSWCVHFETSDDDGKTWQKRTLDCEGILCIQPALLRMGGNHVKALCRTRNQHIAMTESFDNGTTWTKMQLTELPNNDSGIDAVTLRDGRHLLVYNPNSESGHRSPLTIAMSSDSEHWTNIIDLEEDDRMEYSYPCIIQASDNRIWVLYTWHRKKIAYVVLEMAR